MLPTLKENSKCSTDLGISTICLLISNLLMFVSLNIWSSSSIIKCDIWEVVILPFRFVLMHWCASQQYYVWLLWQVPASERRVHRGQEITEKRKYCLLPTAEFEVGSWSVCRLKVTKSPVHTCSSQIWILFVVFSINNNVTSPKVKAITCILQQEKPLPPSICLSYSSIAWNINAWFRSKT